MPAALWAVSGGLAGLIIGSFIATLVVRWPQGQGMGGRSACDRCGRWLGVVELIPLVGFLIVRGKCAACGARIDRRHPAIEILAAMIGTSALWVMPDILGVASALFGWQLLALAALDAEHYWLPDPMTAVLAISGLAFGVAGIGIGLQSRLIGGGVGFAALFAVAWTYRKLRGRDGLGGGDPKFLGAIGCWMGWSALPYILIFASLIGLLVALFRMARGATVAATTRLPFGTLMAAAAFPLWLLFSQI